MENIQSLLPPRQFDYLKEKRLSWSDLGLNVYMTQAQIAQKGFLNTDVIDSLIDQGAIDGNKLSYIDAIKITAGFIDAERIEADTITTEKLTVGSLRFVSSLTWTSTDQDTATWSTGTITLSDGTAYSIATGNTGNILATTYVYLDPDASTTVLQTTTTRENAVGDKKILLAIVTAGVDSSSKCLIELMTAPGTQISGDNIRTGTLSAGYVDVGSSGGSSYVRLDGPNNRIVVHDGTNPRIVIGNV